MPLPYSTPPSAWRYVIILHRLAALPPGQPLRIAPAKSSSINTARAKLFQGRSHIAETHDQALARYTKLAFQTIIHTDANTLTIERAAEFDAVYSALPSDAFTNVYREINRQLLTLAGKIAIPSFGVTLSPPQVKALKDFLTNIPRVTYVGITPTSLALQR